MHHNCMDACWSTNDQWQQEQDVVWAVREEGLAIEAQGGVE
jgi:hypothetical protein